MPRSCCPTLVLVLVSLVYPVGAPVAIAFSRGCGIILFMYALDQEDPRRGQRGHLLTDSDGSRDIALILLGVGVGGLFSGWSVEPLGVLKLSFGYGVAVIRACRSFPLVSPVL